jgi:proline dehydrogenase
MPGEDVGAALGAATSFAGDGIGTVLTNLGERVTTPEEAAGVAAQYQNLAERIRAQHLPTHISVKLTHLGLDLDRAQCTRAVIGLARDTAAAGSFLWIDMEESEYVDRTLSVFREARAACPSIGVCLQAYLHRTPADVDSLLADGAAIRLVKGAYREPPTAAIPQKRDVDAAYVRLSERLLARAGAGAPIPAFGTHDLRILDQVRAMATARNLPGGAYEVHMLYGIKSGELRQLAQSGVTARVLISYGSHWFPWYMRRLAERPANVWFVVRNLVG